MLRWSHAGSQARWCGIEEESVVSILLRGLSRFATFAAFEQIPERATLGLLDEMLPGPWSMPRQFGHRPEGKESDGNPSLELRATAAASRRSRSCTKRFGGTSRRSSRRSK